MRPGTFLLHVDENGTPGSGWLLIIGNNETVVQSVCALPRRLPCHLVAMNPHTDSKTPAQVSAPAGERTLDSPRISDDGDLVGDGTGDAPLDPRIMRRIDLRLCTIAGLLCALDLIDSGIMSSASATSMPSDLGLTGNRYSTAIWIVTVAQVVFKLPATILMRFVGPPAFFTCATVLFGLITLGMGYVTNWRQMIALRFLMGLAMSGIYPGLAYLISTWWVPAKRLDEKRDIIC